MNYLNKADKIKHVLRCFHKLGSRHAQICSILILSLYSFPQQQKNHPCFITESKSTFSNSCPCLSPQFSSSKYSENKKNILLEPHLTSHWYALPTFKKRKWQLSDLNSKFCGFFISIKKNFQIKRKCLLYFQGMHSQIRLSQLVFKISKQKLRKLSSNSYKHA